MECFARSEFVGSAQVSTGAAEREIYSIRNVIVQKSTELRMYRALH